MYNRNTARLPIISALFFMLTATVFAKDDHDGRGHHGNRLPNMFSSENSHGKDATFSTAGFIDLDNPFFKSIGTNGRSCASCHAPDQGWTITPKAVKKLFDKTKGLDPLFRLVDGANSPLADVTTVDKRRAAYSMLIKKANIRVGIGIPSDAEFELIDADDPYFQSLRTGWGQGLRRVFNELPAPQWLTV